MVRITLYDPKVSAEVYSQRRAAEQGFDSGVATGLARLGRALTEREHGHRAANSEAVALRAAMGFWEEEVRRLDKLGAKVPPGKPGFHDMAMKEHLAERDRRIAALKEADPEAVEVFDRHTRALTGILEHRAGVMESVAVGDGLAGALEGAMTQAVRAAKTDPLQHDAILERFDDALAAIEANGIIPEGVAGTRQAARRNVGMAAVGGLIADGEFEAARELLTEDRLPALAEEDRKHLGRRLQREEDKSAAQGDATQAAGIAAYRDGFREIEAELRVGREVTGVDYADETIRRVLPEDQAEEMIAAREAAEDRGAAYRLILYADRATIEAMIAEAGPKREQFMRDLVEDRDRALRDNPAAFMLEHPWVRGGYDRLLEAIEGGDADAIAAAGRAYARATVNEQRRLEVPEAGWQVLPPDLAAETVAAFRAETSDPVKLGTELRARYGELSPIVLQDLVRAGLRHGVATIAAMRRPEQQEAARALSALVGVPTSELRMRISQSDAEAVDRILQVIRPSLPSSDPSDPESAAKATLIERRIYDLMASGEALEAAAVTAVSDVTGDSTAAAAELRASWINPDNSNLVPVFEEYSGLDPDSRRDLQRVIFSRLPHSLLRQGRSAPEDIAWLERALLGEDQEQQEFAATYLEFTGSAIYLENDGYVGDEPLQSVLSPEAVEAYLRYWHDPFEEQNPLHEFFGAGFDLRTIEAAKTLTDEWPVPDDIAVDLLEAIQLSIRSPEAKVEALLAHIDRIVAPLNWELAQGMKSAVEERHAGRNSLDTIPGRYAFLFSNEDLLDAAEARRLLKVDFTQSLDPPPDLAEHMGILTPAGSVVAAGSGAEVLVAGVAANPVGAALAAAGLIVAGADLYGAIDDSNEAHTDYLIRREIQRRTRDPRFNEAFLEAMRLRREEIDPNEPTVDTSGFTN